MARDKIHEIVKRSLVKDGWTITDDPLVLLPGEDDISVDLGAEKVITAERGTEKIAVEVKTFDQPSVIYEFHKAIGQYFDYETALIVGDENRTLFLAVPNTVYPKFQESRVISASIERAKMKLILIDILEEEIEKWIK